MNARVPRVRLTAQTGLKLARDGLSIGFYMRRSHQEIGRAVMQSLDTYVGAVGSRALAWYPDMEGEWQELDEQARGQLRNELHDGIAPHVTLSDGPDGAGEYLFEYRGRWLEDPQWSGNPGLTCAATFWLPTEYLEQHGPARVRELALALAAPLPFNSGHAGLSINALMGIVGVGERVYPLAMRHPGMDVPDDGLSTELGTRVRGASWLTFLGQPILGELGGVQGLRSRLSSPGTAVQEMDGDRAVITLGMQPEAGDVDAGQSLPHYRELAQVLKPYLFETPMSRSGSINEPKRRWERRFLD